MTKKEKASIDKPWLQFYPKQLINIKPEYLTLEEYFKKTICNQNSIIFEYFGYKMTWSEFWDEVEKTSKALCALGIKKEDKIPVFLPAIPEYYIILFAAEQIGATIICRDDKPEELYYAIKYCNSNIAFFMDYLNIEEENYYREKTTIKRFIKISPYCYANKEKIPEYEKIEIQKHYCGEFGINKNDLSWTSFLELGKNIQKYKATTNPNRPLLGAYTSGSTGISKLVVHSAKNMVSIASQMSAFVSKSDIQEKWWLPILPPALIAVTVSMTLFSLSVGLYVELDPYCTLKNLDIAFMEQKPNYWALIPQMCEILMESSRIPENFDMSFLKTIGTGAEPMNEKKSQEVEAFFHSHNVKATLSAGYGQSEGCSNFTLPNPKYPLKDGCVGIPMPETTLAVFDEQTLEEKNYGELGEICMKGPSMMLYYSGWKGKTNTQKTLIKHSDGNTWLHTGDRGYITKYGIVHIIGRGKTLRYGGGELCMMRMESKTVMVPGIKDAFYCFVPNQKYDGYFEPYLFVILDGTSTLAQIKENLKKYVEKYEYPVDIRVIKHRPYFHFKTNRKLLVNQILSELNETNIVTQNQ